LPETQIMYGHYVTLGWRNTGSGVKFGTDWDTGWLWWWNVL